MDHQGLGTGPVKAETIGEGHSNVTFLIQRDTDAWVLRRPPRGPLPPSAHDVLREYRLLEAIKPAPVRTPQTVCACDDESVIGAPFYVMDLVEGDVITSEVPAALDTPTGRRGLMFELIDALAELHSVDPFEYGLEWFGKPDGYLDRQLRRFNGLWDLTKTRELTVVEQVASWLHENKPKSGTSTIVHGDYRLGNVMFAPGSQPRVAAIFDWELSTIGDPLADVGYLTATYVQPDDPESVLTSLGTVTLREGFPNRNELVARYEQRSGRSVQDLRWYQALALWKMAIFLEGNYKRLLAGTTDDPFYRLLDTGVPELAERAWLICRDEAE